MIYEYLGSPLYNSILMAYFQPQKSKVELVSFQFVKFPFFFLKEMRKRKKKSIAEKASFLGLTFSRTSFLTANHLKEIDNYPNMLYN